MRLFAGVDDLMLLKFSRVWLIESDVEICYEEADAAAVHARDDGQEPHIGAYTLTSMPANSATRN